MELSNSVEHARGAAQGLWTHLRKRPVNEGSAERVVSVVGGLALLGYGLARRGVAGPVLAMAGGAMVAHGITGHSRLYEKIGVNAKDATPTSHPLGRTIHVRRNITIGRPASDLYAAWRQLENLPRFMAPVREVRVVDQRRTHWVADTPVGILEWDERLVRDDKDHLLAWESVGGGLVRHQGQVSFIPAPGGQGTEVRVEMDYHLPGGVLAAGLAEMFGMDPDTQAGQTLRRFKQLMETGEVATNAGPSCRDKPAQA